MKKIALCALAPLSCAEFARLCYESATAVGQGHRAFDPGGLVLKIFRVLCLQGSPVLSCRVEERYSEVPIAVLPILTICVIGARGFCPTATTTYAISSTSTPSLSARKEDKEERIFARKRPENESAADCLRTVCKISHVRHDSVVKLGKAIGTFPQAIGALF